MSNRPKRIGWLLTAGKVALVLVLVWAFHATLTHAWSRISQEQWEVQPAWLVVSAVLYVLGVFPQAAFFHRVLAASGHRLHFWPTVRSCYCSQLGKYVPGKAMVLVLRAGLMREAKVPLSLVTAAVFYETLTAMAAGALLALLFFLSRWPQQRAEALAALLMLLATGLPTLPIVFRVAIRLGALLRINLSAIAQLRHIGLGVIAWGWLTIAIGWVFCGASLMAILHSLGKSSGGLDSLALDTAVVCLSVVAGFLALIPGGLGVRDLATIGLLTPVYGDSTALVATVLLRVVWLVAEGVLSIILYLVPLRHATPPPATTAHPATVPPTAAPPSDAAPPG